MKAKNGAPLAFLLALPLAGEGCIIWPFYRDNDGYGRLWIDKQNRNESASRLACIRANGPPPPGALSAHNCGKGDQGCVAPYHLTWKPPKGNSEDMVAHGRSGRGERNPSRKLTREQAEMIRGLVGLSHRAIASQYGVSRPTVTAIRAGRLWSNG